MPTSVISKKDFTYRDYDKILERVQQRLQTLYPNLVNDYREDQLARFIAEIGAFISDRDAFYIDYLFNEHFIDSVTEMKNMRSLAKLVGYQVQGYSCAYVDVDCTTDLYTQPLTIEKGAIVQGISPQFIVAEELLVTGEQAFSLSLAQGTLVVDNFISNGEPWQQFTTTRGKVAHNFSVVVSVDDVEWVDVNVLLLYLEGNYYEIEWIEESKVLVTFGNGVSGTIPPEGASVKIAYLITEGPDGNLASGSINSSFVGTDDAAQIITVDCVNPLDASGGDDEEDIQSARRNVPAWLAQQDRIVTPADYEASAEAFPGILRAKVDINIENRLVTMYLLGDGYGPVAQEEIEEYEASIEDKRMLGWYPIMTSVQIAYIDIKANVYVKRQFDPTLSESRTNQSMYDWFEPTDPNLLERGIGDAVYMSDIIRLLDEQHGVEYVDLTQLTRQPGITFETRPGVWQITGAETLIPAIAADVWHIEFTSDTAFSIYGDVHGPQTPGVVDVTYVTDGGELTFLIPTTPAAPIAGDRANIITSAYKANTEFELYEFVRVGTLDWNFSLMPIS